MNAEAATTILVVDDDARAVELMRLILQHAGYRVVTAGDGATALELLPTERPRLVIADFMMPGMTGLDLCRRARAEAGSGFAFVLLTGMDDEATRRQAQEAGADDVLTKPFDRMELLARLARLLQR